LSTIALPRFDEQLHDCVTNHITKNLYLHISFRRFAMQMAYFTPCICLDYNIFTFWLQPYC